MPIFSKESLETLRQKIDLVDVLSAHIELKRAGASYKGLCPFHDEKTPSFVINKGDTHYHCFGCGAHGDAIQFLMEYQKLSFTDAIQNLAERFHVILDTVEGQREDDGFSRSYMKEAMDYACQLFQFYILHTGEGHSALQYLYRRGIDLEFIEKFRIGLAPKDQGLFRKTMHAKRFSDEVMVKTGLLSENKREFFADRITFPIQDAAGSVIGFSSRKYKEDTFGGKYVNTPETPLFKKSRVLFGLHYSRRRIAKERQALIVEGQIDALRLIHNGFDLTVAGQGTAFGEGHVNELLKLGVFQIWLALDSDNAGQMAALKIGNLFQKAGVEVRVLKLPPKSDPDSFLMLRGSDAFSQLMEEAPDYLAFAVGYFSQQYNLKSPAGKNELVQTIASQIRGWEEPVMVQESLRRLAQLTQVSESLIGCDTMVSPNMYIKQRGNIVTETIDPDQIIESDFLRWLFVMGEAHSQFIDNARANIKVDYLKNPGCRELYILYLKKYDAQEPKDLLALAMQTTTNEAQKILSTLLDKKINRDRVEVHFYETIQKILDRNWMQEREEVRMKIQSGECSEDEVLDLVKQFEEIKKNPPKIIKMEETVYG